MDLELGGIKRGTYVVVEIAFVAVLLAAVAVGVAMGEPVILV